MHNKEEENKSFEIHSLKRNNKEKDELINELKTKIVSFESEKLMMLDDRAKLAKLYDMGLIDSAGDPILVDPKDFDEAESKEELMKF